MKKFVRESLFERINDNPNLKQQRTIIIDKLLKYLDLDPTECTITTFDNNHVWIELDTFGNDDVFEIDLIFTSNNVEIGIRSADLMNHRYTDYTVTYPISNFDDYLSKFWDIHFKHHKYLSKRRAEEEFNLYE
jgi:hypothetical protein